MLNGFLNGVLLVFGGRGVGNVLLRWVSTTLLLALMSGMTAGIWLCRRDVHSCFWLGLLPVGSLSVTLLSLVLSSSLLVYKVLLSEWRRQQHEMRRVSGRSEQQQESFCRLSTGMLRSILLLIVAAATAATGMGLTTLRLSHDLCRTLLDSCGVSGTSQHLQNVAGRLTDLRQRCSVSREGDQDMPLHRCEGFTEDFPSPQPYASYIKALEEEFSCSGFCYPLSDAPLWTSSTKACATPLAKRLWETAVAAGVSSAVVGSFIVIFGIALYNYDEL